jgi:hypothetical protein
MSNGLAAIIVFVGMALATMDIVRSLDCIGGNKAACAIVALRYAEPPHG